MIEHQPETETKDVSWIPFTKNVISETCPEIYKQGFTSWEINTALNEFYIILTHSWENLLQKHFREINSSGDYQNGVFSQDYLFFNCLEFLNHELNAQPKIIQRKILSKQYDPLAMLIEFSWRGGVDRLQDKILRQQAEEGYEAVAACYDWALIRAVFLAKYRVPHAVWPRLFLKLPTGALTHVNILNSAALALQSTNMAQARRARRILNFLAQISDRYAVLKSTDYLQDSFELIEKP